MKFETKKKKIDKISRWYLTSGYHSVPTEELISANLDILKSKLEEVISYLNET